ncbi:MAG: crossover junction endodeoxyribonuclease RuvC [Bacteroidales bacterium]|nr:crossover junction endodeoxyribonuclease RuvC [Bacteroidales bacterium]
MQTKEQIILGIDPGTNIMGYGIIQVKDKKISIMKMDVLKLEKQKTHIERLKDIFEGVTEIIETHLPDNVAIEEPFYGKNIQSMLKLGRAQGVAIAAAMHKNIPVYEYSPRKVKLAITGKGNASKEQVAAMLHHLAEFEEKTKYLDATDAVGIAICHYLQGTRATNEKSYSNWKTFLTKNSDRIIP